MRKTLALIITVAVASVLVYSPVSADSQLLSYGSENGLVYELQLALADLGYFYEEPTGYFGDITRDAVISYQSDAGLYVDGIAGPETLDSLGIYYYDDSSIEETSFTEQSDPLRAGMSGPDVCTLQELLAQFGYFDDEITGFFGDLTEAALISFQEDYGLEVDGIAGYETFSVLLGSNDSSSSFDYVSAIMDAINRTPPASAGYCASWVTAVLMNAGIISKNIGYNANDYWANVCYSEDIDDLQPGMIVATRYSYTYLGSMYGHVGIYLGDGQVISSIGYLEILDLDEFNRQYNNTGAGSTIRWGYMPVS